MNEISKSLAERLVASCNAIKSEWVDRFVEARRVSNAQAASKFPIIPMQRQGKWRCKICVGRGLLKSLHKVKMINIEGRGVMDFYQICLCPECLGEGVSIESRKEWAALNEKPEQKGSDLKILLSDEPVAA